MDPVISYNHHKLFLTTDQNPQYSNILGLLNKTILFFERKIPDLFSSQKNYANLHGAWGAKEVAPVTLFERKKLYKFEGREYWSIEDADWWLKKVYGDYMKLPDPSNRNSPHVGKIIYSNLNDGIERK